MGGHYLPTYTPEEIAMVLEQWRFRKRPTFETTIKTEDQVLAKDIVDTADCREPGEAMTSITLLVRSSTMFRHRWIRLPLRFHCRCQRQHLCPRVLPWLLQWHP